MHRNSHESAHHALLECNLLQGHGFEAMVEARADAKTDEVVRLELFEPRQTVSWKELQKLHGWLPGGEWSHTGPEGEHRRHP